MGRLPAAGRGRGADHRAVDGASLAAASNAWRALVEHPARLLLTLR